MDRNELVVPNAAMITDGTCSLSAALIQAANFGHRPPKYAVEFSRQFLLKEALFLHYALHLVKLVKWKTVEPLTVCCF